MNVRKNLHAWLVTQAGTLQQSDELYGLAINSDVAEMVGANADKHFGVTLSSNSARKLRNSSGELIDKDGEFEVIAYAHVDGRNKKDRAAQYEQVELIISWLEQLFEEDPSADGTLCPNATFGIWRTPARGDALDSQPYVLAIAPLSYEEP